LCALLILLIVSQCELAHEHFLSCLAAAGMSAVDVVKVNVILAENADDMPAREEFLAAYLKKHAATFCANVAPPAHTMSLVSTLGDEKWMLELDGVAAQEVEEVPPPSYGFSIGLLFAAQCVLAGGVYILAKGKKIDLPF